MSKLTKKQTDALLLMVRDIKALEAQKKDIDAQIKEKTDMVKELMESKQLEEAKAGESAIRMAKHTRLKHV